MSKKYAHAPRTGISVVQAVLTIGFRSPLVRGLLTIGLRRPFCSGTAYSLDPAEARTNLPTPSPHRHWLYQGLE